MVYNTLHTLAEVGKNMGLKSGWLNCNRRTGGSVIFYVSFMSLKTNHLQHRLIDID